MSGLNVVILLALLPLAAMQLVLLIAALMGIMRKDVTGSEKLPWVILVIFVSLIGPILYFAMGSKILDEKARNGH